MVLQLAQYGTRRPTDPPRGGQMHGRIGGRLHAAVAGRRCPAGPLLDSARTASNHCPPLVAAYAAQRTAIRRCSVMNCRRPIWQSVRSISKWWKEVRGQGTGVRGQGSGFGDEEGRVRCGAGLGNRGPRQGHWTIADCNRLERQMEALGCTAPAGQLAPSPAHSSAPSTASAFRPTDCRFGDPAPNR